MEKDICLHETEFQELKKKADGHVSWGVYWSITGVLITLALFLYNSILSDREAYRHATDEKISELSRESNESKVAFATIQTQLAQIQKDLAELKSRR